MSEISVCDNIEHICRKSIRRDAQPLAVSSSTKSHSKRSPILGVCCGHTNVCTHFLSVFHAGGASRYRSLSPTQHISLRRRQRDDAASCQFNRHRPIYRSRVRLAIFSRTNQKPFAIRNSRLDKRQPELRMRPPTGVPNHPGVTRIYPGHYRQICGPRKRSTVHRAKERLNRLC